MLTFLFVVSLVFAACVGSDVFEVPSASGHGDISEANPSRMAAVYGFLGLSTMDFE
jgi:hypothetical protein